MLFQYTDKQVDGGDMRLQRLFFLTFSFFLILWGLAGNAAGSSAEIQKIDSEIEQLKDMKRGYEARALRHEDFAEYLQFDQQAVLETRRHLQIAEENRNKAALIQAQIDKLNERKEKLKK